ncbi:SCD6 protein-like protein [Hirschfeldia incana]|nr:SCD6 protein-like protein [Hirschfeldia incana]
MMATGNSQCISSLSSSLRKPQPRNPRPVDYFGSFITLDIGVDSPASLARGLSSMIYRPPKPPLPYVYTSYNQDGAKIRQKVQLLISNEKLSKTEAITDDYDASSIKGPVNDGLQIACKPLALLQQYHGSNYYYPWLPMPCAGLYQDPTYASPSSIASQSFFTTYPSVPFSLRQGNGGFDFETLPKNFKPYKLWGPEEDNSQEDQTVDTVDGSSYQSETWNYQNAYSIDGSSYLNEISNIYQGNNNQEDQTAYNIDDSFNMNSRNPFDPIGRPWNPFGPIKRPLGPIKRPFPYLPSSHELADLGFV